MYWIIYIFTTIPLSYVLANAIKKYSEQVFIFLLIALLTPAKIELSSLDYAPSIFTYIFNVVFEHNFSTRVLRPLALSLPLGLISIVVFSTFKRKFF